MSARVLVVDDTPLNVKLLEARLSREYYTVDVAVDGVDALEKAAAHPPDIVLLDVMMPRLDGFETCKRLKAEPKLKHIPVIIITALSDVVDRVKGLSAGADDFLTKPVNEVALLSRVRSLLRLKMLHDEWRLRERLASDFGFGASVTEAPPEPHTSAHILVLEDDAYERKFITETLKQDTDTVDFSTDLGEAARRIVKAAEDGKPFDLVVGSLSLQGADGLRLCSEMRALELTRHVPILLLADDSDIERIARGLDLGANDYLLRPLDAQELLARARTQIRHIRTYYRLRANYERSLAMALADPLTGAFNRRYMDMHLPRLLERAKTGQRALSAMMLDIDHFKKVNDTHGHDAGDAALRELVVRINRNVRTYDLTVRLGGEEFAVIMPETDSQTAQLIAERVRSKILETPFRLNDKGLEIPVTISIGVATLREAEETPASLLKRADEALYRAKEAGRNRVERDEGVAA